jgi:carboxyl-terminal processing protease
MPIRNVVFIGLAAVISLACHSISVKNRYASVFSEALAIVQSEALVEMSERQLFDAAMNGMLARLDPNSSFISEEEFKAFDEDLNQEFVGVGMEVDRDLDRNCIRVVSPIPGTPAYNAGLRVGDLILEIDGTVTAGLSRPEAVQLIRGPRGEPVVFLISREEIEEPFNVVVYRDAIPVPSIYGDTRNADGSWNFRLEDDRRIGYVRLLQFGKRSTEELQETLEELNDSIDAFVLDLRYNPGGLLEAAIEISDMFIGREVLIVQTRERDGQIVSRRYATSKTVLDTNIPMVVIVNEYSASASEIVAACLQDHSRAVIVGKQTWGKGTVQDLITLERNRSVLRLTTASYWRPSGKNIDRSVLQLEDPTQYGVSPNEGFEVLLTDDELTEIGMARNRRDQAVLQPNQPRLQPDQPAWLETDVPLRRAVEHLQSQISSQAAVHP